MWNTSNYSNNKVKIYEMLNLGNGILILRYNQ